MMTSTLRNLAVSTAVITGLALAGISTLASAGEKSTGIDESPVPKQMVDFRDLDLTKMEDAAELHKRIAAAAYRVCRQHLDHHDLSSRKDYRLCMEAAINKAVHDVGNVNLTMVHEGRSPALAAR